MTLEQGDLRLLDTDLVKRLLMSTGEELVLPTFISAPHVIHATDRVRALRANPDVAVSIDTESFQPEVLSIRGKADITEIDGVAAEYAEASRRFLGATGSGDSRWPPFADS